MPVDADILFDRRRLKRKLVFWRVLGAVALVGLIFSLIWRFAEPGGPLGDHVATLTVAGVITDDQDRLELLQSIEEDDSARALIVYIDSPGGTFVGGETLYLAPRRVAEHKPVVAVMREMAASGGYMTALGADRIFAREGTITGSIGVIMQTADVTGLLDKLGIKPEAIKSSPLKAAPNPLEETTPQARIAMRSIINDMYGAFLEMVVDRRPLQPAEAGKLADGRVFTGRQAVANGLIDAIGGLREARLWLEDTHEVSRDLPMNDMTPSVEDDLVQRLVSSAIGNSGASSALRLDGLLSVWHPQLR